MQIKDYAVHVKRTMNKELSHEELQHNWNFGIIGEFGELVDLLKKHLFHKHELDKDGLIKELGDLCWYLTANLVHNDMVELLDDSFGFEDDEIEDVHSSIMYMNRIISRMTEVNNFGIATDSCQLFIEINTLCKMFKVDFNEVLERNVIKLQKRYQKGFTTEESLKRVDVK